MTEHEAVADPRAVGASDVESEHALQFRLLEEAERLLAARDVVRAREVIQQLYDYSDAHFASEQVLMRLHSYPGYAAHHREHGDLLVALRNLLAMLDDEGVPPSAGVLRRWLTAHVHHADEAFAHFMRTAPLGSASV